MEEKMFQNLQEKKNKSLAEQVAEKINRLIIDRNLTAGDQLPNEYEMAVLLNVGRGTLREAVKFLAARNVLELKRGKGTFIACNIGEVKDPLGLVYIPDQIKVAKELLEIRLELEPWIASLVAKRIQEEQIMRLQEHCSVVEMLIAEGKEHLEADKQFHHYLAECSGNRVMPKLIPVITYSVDLFGNLNNHSLMRETVEAHRSIVEAISQHNAELAYKQMQNHVLSNQRSIEKIEQQMMNGENSTNCKRNF